MSFAQKIKHAWGYSVGPCPPNVVLMDDGNGVTVSFWPDDNPPTIAEIEAVQLPPEPTRANWPAFRLGMISSAAYRRIVGHDSDTLALLPMLVSIGFLIDSDPTKAIDFAQIWNLIASIAIPTTEEIGTLNAIASNAGVPFQLNAQGFIE